jgi:hypothetical protein
VSIAAGYPISGGFNRRLPPPSARVLRPSVSPPP